MSTDPAATDTNTAVRPFHVDIGEEDVVDLRRRIAAWRPPDRAPVDDQSQGVQLTTVQNLADYWATEYNMPPADRGWCDDYRDRLQRVAEAAGRD